MTDATARVRDAEHLATCEALASVAADAPTLCEGWTAHDLACHLWTLGHVTPAWLEVVVPQASEAPALKRRWGYAELVGRLRNRTGRFACMPLDPYIRDRHAIGESFVHGEDVRRANQLARREPSPELDELLWQRVGAAAAILQPRNRGLVLATPDGRRTTVHRAAGGVEVLGSPGELMLWAYGRTSVAQVEVTPRSR